MILIDYLYWGALAGLTLFSFFHRIRDLFHHEKESPEPSTTGTRLNLPNCDAPVKERETPSLTPQPPRLSPPPAAPSGSSRSLNLERMEAVRELAKEIQAAHDFVQLEQLLIPCFRQLCAALSAERATIFVQSQLNELVSFAGIGLSPKDPIIIPEESGIVGESLRLGIPIVSNDTSSDAHHFAAIDKKMGFTTRNAMAVPLKNPIGDRYGVFEIMNRQGGFSAADQAIILPFASALSDALHPHLRQIQARLKRMTDWS